MADLIFEWGVNSLRVIKPQGENQVSAAKSAVLNDVSLDGTKLTVEETADKVRSFLDENNFGRGKAVVVLPRESVVVRQLQLPDAPDDEFPEMVHFQTATKTSSPIEDLSLDYLKLSTLSMTGQRNVMTFTVDRKALVRIQTVLAIVGVTVNHVSTSPLTTANFVRDCLGSGVGRSSPAMIVYQNESRVEISILDGGTLVFSHSTQLPDGIGTSHLKPLQSEIARSTVALSQLHPDVEIEHCYYVGTFDSTVDEFLQNRFDKRFQRVNPKSNSDHGAGLEPLLGAIPAAEDTSLTIDFLHPRQKIEKPDRRKLYAILGVSALALVLLVGGGLFWSAKADLEENIALKETRAAELEGQLKKGKPETDAHAAISEWNKSKMDPIAVWKEFQPLMPSTDRLYLSEFRLLPQDNETAVRITGIGFARERNDIDDFKTRLADNGYRVKPQTTKETSPDPDFPIRFEIDIEKLREEAVVDTKAKAKKEKSS